MLLSGWHQTHAIDHSLTIPHVHGSPDNQEVYSLPSSDNDRIVPGPCIVVELLEYQKQCTNQDAAAYYFQDLAQANSVSDDNMNFSPEQLSVTPSFPNLSAFCSGFGFQNISPGRDVDVGGTPRPRNEVWVKVEIGVMRLETLGTDLLITLSIPSSSTHGQALHVDGFSETFRRAIETLSIQNWGLFG